MSDQDRPFELLVVLGDIAAEAPVQVTRQQQVDAACFQRRQGQSCPSQQGFAIDAGGGAGTGGG